MFSFIMHIEAKPEEVKQRKVIGTADEGRTCNPWFKAGNK